MLVLIEALFRPIAIFSKTGKISTTFFYCRFFNNLKPRIKKTIDKIKKEIEPNCF
jgi:hypothetical protein